ncbi:hypothetical protein Vadar_003374 [Vaccinium darrowii]|uniref:Uncharacterized protein n=1 Tax=Vaccinium darrowii TaxID=229202 RepID=A0ACB7XPB9_9ERIC|nr:hypothetical protein Vadar_003374 [Vaccinium darrowii]
MANVQQKTLTCFCYWGGKRTVNSNCTFSYDGGFSKAVLVKEGLKLFELIEKICAALKTTVGEKKFFYNTKRDKTKCLLLDDEDTVAMMFHCNEDEVDLFVEEPPRSNDDLPAVYSSTRESFLADNTVVASNIMEMSNSRTKEMGMIPYLPEDANEILSGKGQLFDSPDLFKQALMIFAASNKFSFKYLDNSKAYYRVVCQVEGCPWKLTARCDGGGDVVRVIGMKNEHIHNASDGSSYKATISSKQVGLFFKNKIVQKPSFLPRDICNEFENAFQYRMSYKQGWRAKEHAKECISGPPSSCFHLLPWMCRRLEDAIPGTRAVWTSNEGKFKQLFVSYGCSIAGFKYCRPVLKLDACFLTGYYRGHCLSASAHDADDGLYPLAYAIVSSENDDDWLWFLQNLKEVIGERRVVLITDRNTSLLNGIIKVFGGDCNAWCLRHLKENFSRFSSSKGFKNERRKAALKIVDQIAYARTENRFNFHMGRLRGMDPELAKWVEDNNPNHWSNAYFPYKRWDKMYTNLAECFNNWILPLRDLDIMQFMTGHVTKVTDMLLRKRAAICSWKLPVGPQIEKEIKEHQFVARKYMHRPTSPTEFTVLNTHQKQFAVKFDQRTCSCLAWQMSGVPCAHACRAIQNSGFCIYDMVDPMMSKSTQILIYENSMSPVPLHDMPPLSSFDPSNLSSYITDEGVTCTDPVINPPSTKRGSGRPKKRRIESQTQERDTVNCSRCREPGHNRSTCKSAIPG